ncbi:SCO family protein [Sphingobacterium bambusae]|uniref:SCO family protein n=1 Tax=Sphingobacterium bambusae TaxID=662858 RepID=A0ABW6BMW0_9SPHI|nr:SCO family protein [Sphingobacterium bambusae]WPL47842.1 SCO family protein [Sphingobacterium bambusae]
MKRSYYPFLPFLAWGILLFSCTSQTDKKLPIIGERETQERVVDGKTIIDTIYPKIPAFSFLNQDSVMISEKTFDNQIYVANFFFTHCPSICPTMQRNLLKVYDKYKGDKRIAFLSHSIDFKYDSPSVLKSYANKLGVDNDQWQFVTGSKKDIYGIANNYLVYTKEDASVPGGYDHQGYLVLIDQHKHIRGAYDGTNDEQVAQLFTDLEILFNEKP